MPPGDPSRHVGLAGGGLVAAALERDPGDVERIDRPAAFGEPDRVGALAGSDVERPARREFSGVGHELRVGVAAPDAIGRSVTFVPERLVHHRDVGVGGAVGGHRVVGVVVGEVGVDHRPGQVAGTDHVDHRRGDVDDVAGRPHPGDGGLPRRRRFVGRTDRAAHRMIDGFEPQRFENR